MQVMDFRSAGLRREGAQFAGVLPIKSKGCRGLVKH
jgi:hypothetical protein